MRRTGSRPSPPRSTSGRGPGVTPRSSANQMSMWFERECRRIALALRQPGVAHPETMDSGSPPRRPHLLTQAAYGDVGLSTRPARGHLVRLLA